MQRPGFFGFEWRRHLATIGAFGFIVLGCGSSGPESVSTSSSALSGGTVDSGEGCPRSAPSNGSECSSKGLECSWGTDPRFGCRTQAFCEKDEGRLVWEVNTSSCPEPPPTCPKHAPDPTGHSCLERTKCSEKELGATCVYDDVAYTCAPCSGNLCCADAFWAVTDLNEGCPDAVPNYGEACGTPKLYCDYNSCADSQQDDFWAYGIGVRCDDGQWQYYAKGACP
jgi:hypothetical protein